MIMSLAKMLNAISEAENELKGQKRGLADVKDEIPVFFPRRAWKILNG